MPLQHSARGKAHRSVGLGQRRDPLCLHPCIREQQLHLPTRHHPRTVNDVRRVRDGGGYPQLPYERGRDSGRRADNLGLNQDDASFGMPESITARTDRLFEAARTLSRQGAKVIMAEHSSKGTLRSGKTIVRVVSAFQQRSRTAREEALESVAVRVDHRGRKWQKMFTELEAGIDRHMDLAHDTIGDVAQVAGSRGESLLAPMLSEIGSKLHLELADYREGWTAPPGKLWRARNAALYALLLLAAGACLGERVKAVVSWLAAPASASAPATKLQSPAG